MHFQLANYLGTICTYGFCQVGCITIWKLDTFKELAKFYYVFLCHDIVSLWEFKRGALLHVLILRPYVHIKQIQPSVHGVLCLALHFQQCPKNVFTYVLLNMHDIKIVWQQQVLLIRQPPPSRFSLINHWLFSTLSFLFSTVLTWIDIFHLLKFLKNLL